MSVIAFEKFALGLQADRSTPLQAPTYYINFSGSLTPQAPTQSTPVSDGTLAARARSKQIKPEETQGGTFSITNHGVGGSLAGTPIINQPIISQKLNACLGQASTHLAHLMQSGSF